MWGATTVSMQFSATPQHREYDAIVVGTGPNGFGAAITLQQHQLHVLMVEAEPTCGGGMRTKELTLPGFRHDVCATIHAMGAISPFLTSLPLEEYGLQWSYPPVPCTHPLDNGDAVALYRSVTDTARQFGKDYGRYETLMAPLVHKAPQLLQDALAPLRLPHYPVPLLQLGIRVLWSAHQVAHYWLRDARAQALFAGMAAHAVLPLERWLTAAVGTMLCVSGHVGGWPVVVGGSQYLADALSRYFIAHGGEIVCGWPVRTLLELPKAQAVLFDTAPHSMGAICQPALPAAYLRRLMRYRYGPAAFKVDFALANPIPWSNPLCHQSANVHVGGDFAAIAMAERAPWHGQTHPLPFVLVAQQTLFDTHRAPAGKHTAWAYCHVPNGARDDCTAAIEAQIERFAPGFRDCIVTKHRTFPRDLARYNPNYVGGDIIGGVQDVWQLFTRPVARLNPYTTPNPRLYICSAATPPGGGVHGMCGVHAARAALPRAFGLSPRHSP